jgi:2-polyprenyl-6-hydroxyphenyl methylase/3-demethylubiquinone-9 3-methyltransferase|tara:strand:- start:1782 stop:2507 length:726 start_codon:yes stop_codon:yes gene_type:complete
MESSQTTTEDQRETDKFNRLAVQWWDPKGLMWPLHRLNDMRAPFVIEKIQQHFNTVSLKGLRILDIGCGAGLLAERMAKQGATVIGIDVAAKNIGIARQHAQAQGLVIDYRCGAVEALKDVDDFDVVLNMEVIEHVSDLPLFMSRTCDLTGTGGLMFLATINRTWFSWLTTIVGAEYILGWLPRGTHTWQRYVTPEEAELSLQRGGLSVLSRTGVGMSLWRRHLFLTGNMRANYMMVATKI